MGTVLCTYHSVPPKQKNATHIFRLSRKHEQQQQQQHFLAAERGNTSSKVVFLNVTTWPYFYLCDPVSQTASKVGKVILRYRPQINIDSKVH